MKINKSKLFKTAWEIAKKAAVTFKSSAKLFFVEALKQAWREIRRVSGKIDIEKLKKRGKEWIKGDHHRIYFNNLLQYLNTENMRQWQKRLLGRASVYFNVINDIQLSLI